MNDLKNGVPLESLASDLADMIGRWGTQTFVSDDMNKETHQINFGINNVMVGGLGQDHTDMSNELSYLFLHLVALLKLSSPTVGLRWNSQTRVAYEQGDSDQRGHPRRHSALPERRDYD